MIFKTTGLPEAGIDCSSCEASCCRLEVLLITETGVPAHYIETDQWGGTRMARLHDGWCSALDRNTMRCTIYTLRPKICRDLDMGAYDCLAARTQHTSTTTND